jgi:hypothetical protein
MRAARRLDLRRDPHRCSGPRRRRDEIAVTRGDEALEAMISGYNRLQAGDAVLLQISTMTACRRRRAGFGAPGAWSIALPEPATHQGLIDDGSSLEGESSRAAMLVTYVSHRTGLVLPVRDIIEMARTRNVDVIWMRPTPGVRSISRFRKYLPTLSASIFTSASVAWIRVGVAYIRRDRTDAIDPFLGEPEGACQSTPGFTPAR